MVLGGTQVIDSGEFSNCANLNSVTILDTTTIISTFAFSGTNLRTIEIPPSVTRIDANAFINTPLSSIIYYGATPTLGANALPVGAVAVNRPFDPRSVVGLRAWFDAQDSATIVRSLSSVSQWSDKSFNGFHMTPGNTSTIRYHAVSPVGGYPALNFSNFSELRTTSMVLSETNSMSAFIVMNQTGLAPVGAGGSANADFFIANDYRALAIATNVPASTISLFRGNTSGTANVNITNTNCITGLVANGTTTASLYLNTSTAVTFVPGATYPLTSSLQYRIGTSKWQGNMCEVLMYSNAVSQGERQAIEGYLAWKWGIQGNLPADHPFKASAPVSGLAVRGNSTPPSAPTSLSATAGNGTATITFTAGANGGSAITNYKYSIDNGATFIAFSPAQTTSPVTITGLTNGTTYSIQLKAVNTAGDGTASSSVSVSLPALKQLQADWAVGMLADYASVNAIFSQGFSIKVATNGDMYVAGRVTAIGRVYVPNISGNSYTFSSIYLSPKSTAGSSGFLIKYNSSGIAQWATLIPIGNGSTTEVRAITLDSNGNIAIVGSYTSTILAVTLQDASGNTHVNSAVTLPTTASIDAFIIEYTPSGTVQWATTIRSSSINYGYAIAVDISNNIYVTGQYSSSSIITLQDASGNTQVNSTFTLPIPSGNGNLFLVKYNTAGIVQWATVIAGDSPAWDDVGYGIVIDSTNNVYITGQYKHTDGVPLTLKDANGNSQIDSAVTLSANIVSGGDAFLVKYNSNGIVQWATTIRGNSNGTDVGYGLAVDASNNVYVTGQYTMSDTTTPLTLQDASGNGQVDSAVTLPANATSLYSDAFLVKYNTDGIVQWATAIRGNAISQDIGYGIVVDSTNSVYITGQYSSANSVTPLALLDASGNTQTTSAVTLPASIHTVYSDAFLVKYSTDGSVQWATAIRGNNTSANDTGYSLAVDSTDNVYITGLYRTANTTTALTLQNASGNTQVNSSVTLPATTNTTAFLVKYNSSGTVQFACPPVFPKSICNTPTTLFKQHSMTKDSSGNIYVIGAYYSSQTITLAHRSGSGQTQSSITLPASVGTSTTVYDVYIIKYNSSGIVQWATTIRGTSTTLTDIGYGIAADASNNIYVTGQYRMPDTTSTLTLQNASGNGQVNSSFTLSANAATSTDVFIVKYDTNGTVQWATCIRSPGTANSDIGYGIAVDSTNSIYVTGMYRTPDTGATVTLQNASGFVQANSTVTLPTNITTSSDIFLVKYNSSGTVQWATAIRGNNTTVSDVGFGIAVDSTNSVYITGQYRTSTTTTPLTLQDASGNSQINSAVTLPANANTSTDVFLVKYNSSGIVQWATAIRGNSVNTSDIGYGIAVDSTNSVYITGQYRMTDTTTPLTLQNASGNTQVDSTVTLPANIGISTDAFLVKYNTAGTVQWATAIRGSNNSGVNDSGNGIAIDALNNVYVTGGYVTDSATTVTILDASGTSQVTTSYSLPITLSETFYLVKYTSNGVAKGACAFVHPVNTTTTTSRGYTCISYLDKIIVYGSYNLGDITVQEADTTGAPSNSSVSLPVGNATPFLLQYTASAS